MLNWKPNLLNFLSKSLIIALLLSVATLSTLAQDSDELRIAATNGDTTSQLKLAFEYFTGTNRPANQNIALLWFRRAAESGSADGMYNVGVCLAYGYGTKPSPYESYQWLLKAANLGVKEANYLLGIYYLEGIEADLNRDAPLPELKPDYNEAERHLRVLAAENHPDSCRKLGELLLSSTEPEKLAEAVELIKVAVDDNDPLAIRMLADCYFTGLGVKLDYDQMLDYLKKAVELGDTESTARLGFAYEYGFGTPPNRAEALKYYQKAAKKGSPLATAKIGDFHLSGDLLEFDVTKALELFNEAAKRDNPFALYKLGWCHETGIGVEQNSVMACYYYGKAARQNEVNAQYLLGMNYLKGNGVKADPQEAFMWFTAAARQNDPRALRELARCYFSGIGTKKDPEAGTLCLELAAAAGDEQAIRLLEVIAGN